MRPKIQHIMIIIAIVAVGLALLPRTVKPRPVVLPRPDLFKIALKNHIETLESAEETIEELIKQRDPEKNGPLYHELDFLRAEIKKLKISVVDFEKSKGASSAGTRLLNPTPR